ncbi:MAG: hypothetical protein JO057_07595 [Chloroflexi bacterium]|nr:hypothetical protein [Chloroflexota bacterium]
MKLLTPRSPVAPDPLDAQGVAARSRQSWTFLLWLALPLVFYLVPLALGYAWNSLSEQHNVLDPPEGYSGRLPDMRITVEAWGASVLTVPLHARLHEYLSTLQIPLWNPYQGLGEPYQAQGDGSPYFPLEVLRSTLPYSLSNYVSVLSYYLSAVFLYLLLRDLELGEGAAIVGGMTWVLSGALSLHLARPEISDQVVMFPVLFWAAARAMRTRTARDYVIFALVTGLNAVAGHIQIAMIGSVLLVAFVPVYAATVSVGPRAWIRTVLTTIGTFVLGIGLAGFYVLPLAEGLRVSYNKDPNLLSFISTPFANVVAFFFPILFGNPFNNGWLPGDDTQTASWENLYAYVGTAVLLIAASGAAWLVKRTPGRTMHAFFLIAGVVLTMRYISAPPFASIDLLPILGRQSPKHGTELMAFCFIIAAAFAIDRWQRLDSQWVKWILVGTLLYFVGSLFTLIGRQGGFGQMHADSAVRFTSATAVIVLAVLGVVWAARNWRRLSPQGATILLGGVLIGELSIYLPLGNSSAPFLYARLVLFGLMIGASLLLALRMRWAAAGVCGLIVVGYGLLIALPDIGLPRAFDVDSPPHFMQWLRSNAADDYRSFGVPPNFSSIDAVQDLAAVGPLAPQDFDNFVQVVGTQAIISRYSDSTTFTLAGLYDFTLDRYAATKPVFDWVGVKYLVLTRNYFDANAEQTLLTRGDGLHEVYKDDNATILQSDNAQPKAEFWQRVRFSANESSTLSLLASDPGSILGPPTVELASVPAELTDELHDGDTTPSSVTVETYRPNFVALHFDAPAAGLAVLKDSNFPGWQATLNGQPADIVGVDGIVRGVFVPGPGEYELTFAYRPASFVQGVWLSAMVAILLAGVFVWDLARRRAGARR